MNEEQKRLKALVDAGMILAAQSGEKTITLHSVQFIRITYKVRYWYEHVTYFDDFEDAYQAWAVYAEEMCEVTP